MCVCLCIPSLRNLFCLHAKSCFHFQGASSVLWVLRKLSCFFLSSNTPTVPDLVTWKYLFFFLFLWCFSFITSACHALCSTHFITGGVATLLTNSLTSLLKTFFIPRTLSFPFIFSTSPQQPLSSNSDFESTQAFWVKGFPDSDGWHRVICCC